MNPYRDFLIASIVALCLLATALALILSNRDQSGCSLSFASKSCESRRVFGAAAPALSAG